MFIRDKKFKKYYCYKLNDGLFDPKKFPDKEGEYEKCRIEYIEYNGKKIKKIVLWDPNFYMDVSNIVSWKNNTSKSPKIRELSQNVISNPEIFGSIIDGANTNCTTLINPMQMRTFSSPVVTGGYGYIDSEIIILTNTLDAGTKDLVSKDAQGFFWPKDSLLSINSGSFKNEVYNEVTFFKKYSIDKHRIKKHVFDYMLLNLGFEKWLTYEDTLHWASIYNIPVVELDCQRIYKYYENEMKNFIEKCHNSNEFLNLEKCKKIIDLIRVLRTFGEVDNYISLFKESFEYALNWETKKKHITIEKSNELHLIIDFLRSKDELNSDEWLDKLEYIFNNVVLEDNVHKNR